MEFFEIFIGGVFINNILLAQFLGQCPFLGTSKKMETAIGMAMAVIFVLVNNAYAMSVSVEKATGMKKLVDRAKGYGMPGVNVDGNDVRKVYLETSKAIQRARKGMGPTLIESMVHRWTGHSISDADIYRTDEERKKGEKKDPIKRIRRELIKEGILTESAYQKIEKRVDEEIEAAVNYSEKECTLPNPEDILRGVYGAN